MLAPNRRILLDITSQKLTLAVVGRGSPQVKNLFTEEFSGFQDGAFLCPEELYPALKKLADALRFSCGIRPRRIEVSIPSDFCCSIVKNVELDIHKKVTADDVGSMFFIGDTYRSHNRFRTVSAVPVFYKTDGGPERLLSPIGRPCGRIVGRLCYILCERYFLEMFAELSKRLKIRFTFSPAVLSQSAFVARQKLIKPFSGSIIVDLGYLNTTVAYCVGQAPVYMRSFALGGGSVAGDITLVKDIPYAHGYKLYEKLNLNLNAGDGEFYTVSDDGQTFLYGIKSVNAVAEERVFDIARYIKAAIDDSGLDIENSVPIYLGGSPLCTAPGVRQIIEGVTRRAAEPVLPDAACLSGAEYFSLAGFIGAHEKKPPAAATL